MAIFLFKKVMKAIFKYIILTAVWVCMFSTFTFSQNVSGEEGLNAFYIEGLGNGGLFSINYDRVVYQGERVHGFIRTGLTEWHADDTNTLDIGIIQEGGILYGGPNHFFDSGVGVTLWTSDIEAFIVPRIGYRFVSPEGLFIRVSPAMLVINTGDKEDSFGGYWLGLAVGYSF